ncbi:MAG TPA: hypothetical protein VLA19_31855, partial [Herpetosiphonaceae bacterium]|nr:hypothetical protein [Herpetosiphonaceae bacterium]
LLAGEPQALPLPELPNRDRWFLPEVSAALTALKRAIDEAPAPDSIRRFCYLALSSLIVARTSVANARDLVHSRHHFRVHATPPNVLARFRQRCAAMGRQMAAFSAQADTAVHAGVVRADARALPLRDEGTQLIFTSPPYCNAVDYTRTHVFAVAWLADILGTSPSDYVKMGRRYIGTDRARKSHCLDDLFAGYESRVAAQAVAEVSRVDRVRAGVLARYFADMSRVLAECGRLLAPGGHAVFVVCPSRIRGVTVPTHRALTEIAAGLPISLRLVEEAERTLDDSRRIMPYLHEGFGQRMRTEYVVVLRRTG